MSPMTTAVMSTVPARPAGMASATSNTTRQVGGVFGIALLGSIVTSGFVADLKSVAHAMNLPPRSREVALSPRRPRDEHLPLDPGVGRCGHRGGGQGLLHRRSAPGGVGRRPRRAGGGRGERDDDPRHVSGGPAGPKSGGGNRGRPRQTRPLAPPCRLGPPRRAARVEAAP